MEPDCGRLIIYAICNKNGMAMRRSPDEWYRCCEVEVSYLAGYIQMTASWYTRRGLQLYMVSAALRWDVGVVVVSFSWHSSQLLLERQTMY